MLHGDRLDPSDRTVRTNDECHRHAADLLEFGGAIGHARNASGRALQAWRDHPVVAGERKGKGLVDPMADHDVFGNGTADGESRDQEQECREAKRFHGPPPV